MDGVGGKSVLKGKLMPVELMPESQEKRKTFKCKHCLKSFKDYDCHPRIFCSRECKKAWRINLTLKTSFKLSCHFCHKQFSRRKEIQLRTLRYSTKGNNKLNFCSLKCSNKYSSKNIYQWRCDSKGANNPAWRGGVSKIRARIESTKKYQEFKIKILTRDNHQCRICQSTRRPEVHHIIPFHKNQNLFLKVANALTLCHKHHNQTKQREHLYINIFNDLIQNKYCDVVVDRFTKMTGKAPKLL